MTEFCTHETSVIHAVKHNAWTQELRAHAAQCPVCSGTSALVPVMQELTAETSREHHPLPSYQAIWIRAQFTRRQEKLSFLDVVVLIGSFIIGLIGLAGLIIWRAPELLQSIPGFKEYQPQAFTDLAPAGIPVLIIIGCVLIYTLLADLFAVER